MIPPPRGGRCDVITSFDVIEHVEEPLQWVSEIYDLLKPGGEIIIGTPSDYPILRKLMGPAFDIVIFNTSHPWIFSCKSLELMFNTAGFADVRIEQKYNFGIGNVINWLQTGTPKGDIKFAEFSDTLDEVWKNEMIKNNMGEYFLVKAIKSK